MVSTISLALDNQRAQARIVPRTLCRRRAISDVIGPKLADKR